MQARTFCGASIVSIVTLALVLLPGSPVAAQPLPAPPPPPAPPAAVSAATPLAAPVRVRPRAIAQVVAVRSGWIYLRSTTPLLPGDAFEVRSQRPVQLPDPVTGQSRQVPSGHPTGRFIVEHVDGGAGAGRLLRGTLAEPGDLAVPTDDAREVLFAPQLWRGMSRLSTTLRPFLAIGELGGGVLAHLLVEHYFRTVPIKVAVELAPAGFAHLQGGGTGAVADVFAKVGFSSSYFELTLDPGGEFQGHASPSHFLLGYTLRLGSLDGFNLIFQNAYRIADGETYVGSSYTPRSKPQFRFASAQGELNIPLVRRLGLQVAGGGSVDWFYGTIGAKTYLRGSGGPGTIILTGGIGVAGIMEEDDNRGVRAYGPLLAFGLDYRF
jgi:hypothetical protein